MRRALLLFAIVLGMSALAASLSRPPEERAQEERRAQEPRESGPPTAAPGPESPASEPAAPLTFEAGADETRRLRAGAAATLEVSVDEAGSVEIPELGLSAGADELTPARFDVLPARPGDYEITFTPAAGDTEEPAGTLRVTD